MHKLLLRDDPATTDTPEITPAVVLVEARAAVATYGELTEIFLIIVIARATQIRLCTKCASRLRRIVVVLEIRHCYHTGELLARLAEEYGSRVVAIILMVEKDIHMVVTILMIPRKSLHECVGAVVGRAYVKTALSFLGTDKVI